MPFWKRKSETWLIVGLGNPGEKYARNHHNIGFMCLDYVARAHKISLSRSRSRAKTGEGQIAGKEVVLAKPQTFVNLSGEAVGKLMRKYRVQPAQMVVVYDELDLPPGRIRIKQGGTSAGHNGIKSIITQTGTEEFIRIRVGIGRPETAESNRDRGEVIDFVLGDFTAEEKEVIDRVIPVVSEAIETLCKEGVTAAMNRFNGTDLSKAGAGK